MGSSRSRRTFSASVRSRARDTAKAERKQFVGLLSDDPSLVLPEGSQIVAGPFQGDDRRRCSATSRRAITARILKRSIALAVVKGGLDKIGESVTIPLANGKQVAAKITSSVFYDSEGARQHVE